MKNIPLNLKELVINTSWNDIWPELIRNFPNVEDQQQGYQNVFDSLHCIDIIESDLVLNIKIFVEDGVRGADVAAYNDECPGGYSMKFTPWGEWLGLQIATNTLQELSHAEILALCLYEMTWGGSSDEEVQNYAGDLKKICGEMVDDM